MIRAMRRPVGLAIAVVFVALLAVPALAATGKDRLVGDCTHSQIKPAQIVLACADANAVVLHVKWRSFGAAKAAGTGTYSVNGCTPNCAAGAFKNYPVKLTASDAKHCADGDVDDYMSLLLAFVGTPPPATRSPLKVALYCPIG
jgi:hypothetical protein